MSDNDNVWKQPEAPPPPLFTGKKEKDLVKQVTDELTERVIKSEIVYYPISLGHSNFHSLYGEAVDKSFLPPVHVSAYVDWQGAETVATNLGIDKRSTIVVHFHKRRLTEDKNLFVREGDFILYGKNNYEIVSLGQPRPLFGQIDSQIEIVATCIRARDGIIPEKKPVASNADDDPRLTAPPCDPLTELRVLDGTGTDTGGSGKSPPVCDEVSERPVNPPPPLFTGVKETNLVKQVNDEVLERVIGQQVVYFPVSEKHSNFHSLYGESVNKTFLPPVRIFAAVEWQGSETTTENYGVDRKSRVTVRFHKRRLTEDQNLFVRVGDFVLYGKILYEIVTTGQPRQLFGQVGQKFEVVAECIKAREGVFKLSPQKQDGSIIDVSSIDPCENATFVNIGEGEKNTGTNIGSGRGIFAGKSGKTLQFKSLVAGDNIVINSTGTEIAISSSGEISGTITNAQTASIATNADKLDNLHATDFTLQYVTSNGATTTNTLSVADLSASVNISASAFFGDGSNLTGISTASTLDQITDNGNTTTNDIIVGNLSASTNVSASAFYGSGLNLSSLTASSIQNFTNDVRSQFSAGSNITITDGVIASTASGSGGGGTTTIGEAEDGTYTDGIFTDFITTTPIGTAVDRFNEILKILAPSPAPDVSRINATTGAGVSSKLSFGSSNTISGYTNVTEVGSFAAVDVASTYESATSGDDFRRGTYNGTSNIEGIVNFQVTADTFDNAVNNFPADSFGNAETGSLELYLNGALIHSIELSSSTIGSGNPGSGTGTHVNGNGSGFINVSVTASAEDRSQNKFSIFQHRTANYRIHTSEQVNGLNHVQVKHSGSWGRKTTNFVQWVKDNDSNALTATNARFANEAGTGSKYLSGVRYFTGGTADYLVDVNNAYRNVYTSQNISFTTSDCSISSQAFPDINTGSGEDETKVLRITGSATITDAVSLSGTIQASVNVAHPLKSDLSSGGTATSTGLLIYNVAGNSTALRERFKGEDFRLTSGSFNAQSDVDSDTWNSQTHMTGVGNHSDGLQFYNARLYSPLATINNGDFRDNNEGGPFGLAPAGNPNYSGISGLRTFFRYFRNSTGSTKRDIVLTIEGNSTTIVPVGTALNSGRIRAFVKIPGSTGFMDIAQEFTYDNTSDGNGAYVLSFDDSVDATNNISFGTKGVANGEDIVLKIEADSSWTGYVDDIVVSFGAGTGTAPTEAPVLDDIDVNDSGESVNLSFGSSKTISGYTNVSTSTGNTAIDLNGSFLDSGDKAGAFNGTTIIDGELNEDVTANGTSYVANSFNNAATGSLKLEVNGAVVHTVDLSSNSVGSGNPGSGTDTEVNGNSSGFTNLSVHKPGLFSGNSIPDWTKIYRTGKYQIGTGDQINGWNYARVIHSGSDIGQVTTNYIEWVNDNNSDALAATNVVFNSFSGSAAGFYMSGVQYFTSCTSSFHYDAANVYKNVYYRPSDGISFPTTTNTTISNITTNGTGLASPGTSSGATKVLPSLATTAGSQNEVLFITGTVSFDPSESLVGQHATTSHTASVSSRVKHPLKSNLTTSTLNKHSFLVFSGSESGDLNTDEHFDGEVYRLQSGSYTTQGSVTNASNTWNSTLSINDVGSHSTHSNGLLQYNDKLISPTVGGLGGDFRGVVNGGALQAPPGNPNYSSLATSTREYYRYFRSNQVGDVSLSTVTLYGDANLVAKGGAFNVGTPGSNKNIHCEVKIPGDTGWLDIARPASVSEDVTQDVGGFNGGGADVNQTIDSDGTSYGINFRTATLNGTSGGNADYLVVRVTAHEDWTGHLTRINFTYG